jgi:hypothetical protein
MEQAEAKRYKERWQKLGEITRREQRESSPETKLRQSTELLRLARRLDWKVGRTQPEVQTVRATWNRLRKKLR